jgi:hypothetical protein
MAMLASVQMRNVQPNERLLNAAGLNALTLFLLLFNYLSVRN